METTLAPTENLEIYGLLFEIEVGLREFVIQELGARYGERWWIDRLPGDVLDSCRTGIRLERSTLWLELVPHHPLYYSNFADLRKVVERRDNWEQVFKEQLGRKDIFAATLSELEPIRNKIAHNRRATSSDLKIVKACRAKLGTLIGEERFTLLVSSIAESADIPAMLLALRSEAAEALESCNELQALGNLPAWTETSGSWWFAGEYLQAPVTLINAYFNALATYRDLPRQRGTGHALERWMRETDLATLYDKSEEEFSRLLDA